MSTDLDLAEGIAQMLNDAGLGTYDPTNTAVLTGTAIVIGDLPDAPASAIGLSPYPVSDNASLPEAVVGVQIMVRGTALDLRPVLIACDAILDLLQADSAFALNGHPVANIWRQNSTPPGRDALGRYYRADSYYLSVTRPNTAYRTD